MTWFDWSHVDADLLAFTKQLIALRAAHPVFRRRRFLAGAEAAELSWFTPAGVAMTTADWTDPNARCLTLYLDGADDPDRAEDGSLLVDDDFLFLVNSWWEPLEFVVPSTRPGQGGTRSSTPTTRAPHSHRARSPPARRSTVGPRSIVLLRSPTEWPRDPD